MRAGGGKGKGSNFEREVCTKLSLWTTDGKSVDVYWRAAMSGGRATVQKGAVRQSGDITAVAPEGHVLTDQLYIECKSYKELSIECFIKGKGPLISFWEVAVKEADKYKKFPALIFKQNNWPAVFCTSYESCTLLRAHALIFLESVEFDMRLIRFDELLKNKFPLV